MNQLFGLQHRSRIDPMILNRPHDPRIEILERENPRPMAEDSSLKRLKHLMRF